MSSDSYPGFSKLQQHATQSSDVVRVNQLVPATLRKEWKVMALASDKALTDLIIGAMQHQLNRHEQTGKVAK